MPLPSVDRAGEYLTKGVELVMRSLAVAPEQRAARRLFSRQERLPSTDGARRVLFLSPRSWADHVQYQAVLGHALRLRGAEVRFLTCGGGLGICDRANTYESPPMPCRTCRRYTHASVDAHGIERRALFAPGYEPDDSWPELDEMSRSELPLAEADGIPFGRLVDTPVKWFLCAGNVESDPLAGQVTRQFLRSARAIARAVTRELDAWTPDVVVLLNGLFLFEAVTWEVCRQRGIDVVTYERAFLKETLVFSRGRPAGFYDFTDDWAGAARPLSSEESGELDRYLDDRRAGRAFDQFWTVREEQVQRRGGSLAVCFTNITWDTAVIGRDVAFPSIQSWLDSVIEAFAGRPDDELVIRVHPSELYLPGKVTRDSLQEHVQRRWPVLPGNVTLIGASDPTSSYPLMDAADVGIVYTSTTGLELALRGTPVIVCGDTHYRGKGFTIDATDPEDFHRLLARVLAEPASMRPDTEVARQYAHFFFFRAPLRVPGVRETLPGLARLSIRSSDELEPGHDADLDRICSGILSGDPFVRA